MIKIVHIWLLRRIFIGARSINEFFSQIDNRIKYELKIVPLCKIMQ